MKKIFGIIFLGILIGGNSFAGVEEVIKEISESGLRGRGGAAFPTGFNWSFLV